MRNELEMHNAINYITHLHIIDKKKKARIQYSKDSSVTFFDNINNK